MRLMRAIAATFALIVAVLNAAPSRAQDHISPFTKGPGQTLFGRILLPGMSIVSADSRFKLSYRQDGNLVLLQGQTMIWQTGTYIGGSNGAKYGFDPGILSFQSDGNLVIYHRFLNRPNLEVAVWSSKTSKTTADRLVIQNDGNVVIFGSDGRAKWSTNTCCR